MKTLYVSDLDGTLLDADSRISPESARLINSLTARGALITVATARTAATVDPLLHGIATTPPAIVMTGAAMWDRARRCYTHMHLVPADDLRVILDVCYAEGLDPLVYTVAPDGILQVYHRSPHLNPFEQAFVDIRSGLPLKHFNIGTPVPPDAAHSCVLLFGLDDEAPISRAAARLRTLVASNVTSNPDYLNPGAGQLEIFGPGVSKARAVGRLKQMMGADRLVVFGDNLNDLPMMEQADLAVAVANAVDPVRRAAHVVIGPNTEPSVARFILDDFNATS